MLKISLRDVIADLNTIEEIPVSIVIDEETSIDLTVEVIKNGKIGMILQCFNLAIAISGNVAEMLNMSEETDPEKINYYQKVIASLQSRIISELCDHLGISLSNTDDQPSNDISMKLKSSILGALVELKDKSNNAVGSPEVDDDIEEPPVVKKTTKKRGRPKKKNTEIELPKPTIASSELDSILGDEE